MDRADIPYRQVSRHRHFISTSLALALLVGAGGVPPVITCTPATCAASAECAAMHCTCCGPNCPWTKGSQKASKCTANQSCPLANSNRPPTATNARPLVVAALTVNALQSGLATGMASPANPHCQTPALPPSTLLRLGCALTV